MVREQRKLAAVLAADIVGYSRLMERDESGTLGRLRMDTPTNRSAMPKANFATWPKVEEVAATILFLASPENKVSRGGVVPVFGAASQTAAS